MLGVATKIWIIFGFSASRRISAAARAGSWGVTAIEPRKRSSKVSHSLTIQSLNALTTVAARSALATPPRNSVWLAISAA